MPIDSDLLISAGFALDRTFSAPAKGDASQIGTLGLVRGGLETITTIDQTLAVAGSNPLSAALGELGDGIGAVFAQSGRFRPGAAATTRLGADYFLTIANRSTTDPFQVTIEIAFSSEVDADGPNAHASATMILHDEANPGLGELFVTQLVSDTASGDQVDGAAQGARGMALFATDTQLIDLIIGPAAFLNLFGRFEVMGQAHAGRSAAYAGFLDTFVSVDAVSRRTVTRPIISIPATPSLMLLGILALGVTARRRTGQGS